MRRKKKRFYVQSKPLLDWVICGGRMTMTRRCNWAQKIHRDTSIELTTEKTRSHPVRRNSLRPSLPPMNRLWVWNLSTKLSEKIAIIRTWLWQLIARIEFENACVEMKKNVNENEISADRHAVDVNEVLGACCVFDATTELRLFFVHLYLFGTTGETVWARNYVIQSVVFASNIYYHWIKIKCWFCLCLCYWHFSASYLLLAASKSLLYAMR